VHQKKNKTGKRTHFHSAFLLGSLLLIQFSLPHRAEAQQVDLEGQYLQVVIDLIDGSVRYEHYLKEANGVLHELDISNLKEIHKIKSGSHIRIRGEKRQGVVHVARLEPSAGAAATQAAAAESVTGTRRVAVMLVNFQNDTREPYTVSWSNDFMFNTVNSWFQEVSYGKVDLIGDVYGWATLPIDGTCSTTQIASEGEKWANDTLGVNLNTYDHIYYVFPNQGCGWAGAAYINGKLAFTDQYFDLRVTTHELGHNLGLQHANGFNCSGCTLSLPISVSQIDGYEDRYDAMGKYRPLHFNAAYKDQLGWIDTDIIEVTNDGVYEINPYELPGSPVKALKILSIDGTYEFYYYLEYRQNIGLDNISDPTVLNGVVIHIYPPRFGVSMILDMTPQTSSNLDIGLAVGESFVDPGRGIRITPLSNDSQKIRVQIEFDPGASPGTLQFALAEFIGFENQDQVTLRVNRAEGINGAVSVQFVTQDRTALSGSDYVQTSGIISYADEEFGEKTFTIDIIDDNDIDPDEDFIVVLENPTGGATIGTIGTATVTILDDDAILTIVRFNMESYTINENDGSVTLTVSRTPEGDHPVFQPQAQYTGRDRFRRSGLWITINFVLVFSNRFGKNLHHQHPGRLDG